MESNFLTPNKKKNLFSYILLFISSILVSMQPAHAYAGPGVAIGAIIVFLTIVVTFFASFFLTIFKYIKRLFLYLKKTFIKPKKLKRGNQNGSKK